MFLCLAAFLLIRGVLSIFLQLGCSTHFHLYIVSLADKQGWLMFEGRARLINGNLKRFWVTACVHSLLACALVKHCIYAKPNTTAWIKFPCHLLPTLFHFPTFSSGGRIKAVKSFLEFLKSENSWGGCQQFWKIMKLQHPFDEYVAQFSLVRSSAVVPHWWHLHQTWIMCKSTVAALCAQQGPCKQIMRENQIKPDKARESHRETQLYIV